MSDFHEEMAAVAAELIAENGRLVTLHKISSDASPSDKPWRGTGAELTSSSLPVQAVFLASYRALGDDFHKDVDQLALVGSSEDLSGYDTLQDGDTSWKIIRSSEIKPGTTRIATFLGVAR